MKKIFYVLLFCVEYVTGSALHVAQKRLTPAQERALNTALFLFIEECNLDKIQQLVQEGASLQCFFKDINQMVLRRVDYTGIYWAYPNMSNLTPLHYASSVCKEETVVAKLLELGANPFTSAQGGCLYLYLGFNRVGTPRDHVDAIRKEDWCLDKLALSRISDILSRAERNYNK